MIWTSPPGVSKVTPDRFAALTTGLGTSDRGAWVAALLDLREGLLGRSKTLPKESVGRLGLLPAITKGLTSADVSHETILNPLHKCSRCGGRRP